jgi:hypothetical protein
MMRHRTRSLTWRGEAFHFQPLPADEVRDAGQWAVICRGEFIGTMQCSSEVTTRDFDVRCIRWLRELLDTSSSR